MESQGKEIFYKNIFDLFFLHALSLILIANTSEVTFSVQLWLLNIIH